MNNMTKKQLVVRREPFTGMVDLQDRINDLFNISLGRWFGDSEPETLARWIPAVDLVDSKDSLTVKADIPGMKKEDIDVSIHEGTLVLKGEKKSEEEKKEKGYVRTERFYGSFYRAISLPSSVDETKIKASYKDGVLELILPKKEEAKPKQIKIDVV